MLILEQNIYCVLRNAKRVQFKRTASTVININNVTLVTGGILVTDAKKPHGMCYWHCYQSD